MGWACTTNSGRIMHFIRARRPACGSRSLLAGPLQREAPIEDRGCPACGRRVVDRVGRVDVLARKGAGRGRCHYVEGDGYPACGRGAPLNFDWEGPPKLDPCARCEAKLAGRGSR